jgi:hypothetical protein
VTFTPPVPVTTPARPKWLSAAAIGVIIVAGFGVLAGLMAPVAVAITRHHPFASVPGAPPEMTKMLELQQKMMSGPAATLSVVVHVIGIAVGAWAIHAAIRVLGAKAGARPTFRRAVAALGAIELSGLVLGVWMQIRNYAILGELTDALSARFPAGTPGFDATMRGVMQGSALVGVVFAVGYGLLKLVFLAWSYHYTSSREVVVHLDR